MPPASSIKAATTRLARGGNAWKRPATASPAQGKGIVPPLPPVSTTGADALMQSMHEAIRGHDDERMVVGA